MRLHRITLKCFRGFPVEETLVFHGKNVLLYGENGSGKSTLFHALREALPRTKNRRPVSTFANTFIERSLIPPPVPLPPSTAKVELEFRRIGALDDLAQARIVTWNHTTPSACTEWEFQTARRIMALDYRSVLETHYVQRTAAELNIYPLLAKTILGSAQNPAVAGNAPPTFREQWQDMLEIAKKRPTRRTYDRKKLGRVYNVITSIQTGLKSLESKIVPLANEYLSRLCTGLTVGIDVKEGPWYEVKPHEKRLTSEGKALVSAHLFGAPVPQPAPFFNEARLSAMALALYLAGVRLSVPDKDKETAAFPRVLVLDDVLIGLDLSHRLPLLELLAEKFSDWQVLLFTHDRAWFELAQLVTPNSKEWLGMQLHAERTQHDGVVFERPKQIPPEQPLENYYLNLADWHLAQHDPRTAAFHTRVAFEAALRAYCHEHQVPVPYYLDGVHLTTEDFLGAIEQWLKERSLTARAAFVIRRVKMFRSRVLNPLAHWAAVVIDPTEVQRAIKVVRDLKLTADKTNFANETKKALAEASPTLEQLLDAAAWLRTTFEVDVRNLLLTHQGQIEYRTDWATLTDTQLWEAAKIRMTVVNAPAAAILITDIETHRHVFLDVWEFNRVSLLTKLQLDAAWTALRDPGHQPKTRLAVFA
jgi:energy-coupling factor transporter ATP-binding protein EcfA2